MAASPHSEPFTVRSYEVTPDSLLRPVTLLRMLQETAWKHASLLGKGYADREGGELFWVLSRLRLRIHSLPRWGEQFTVRTQPIGVEKLFAIREFFVPGESPHPRVQALSGWLLVDTRRGRPVRPGPLLDDIELGEQQFHADLSALPELDAQQAAGGTQQQPVRPHDIDQYGHVNNASYLEWVIDAIDGADSAAPAVIAPPVDLAIDFLKETLPGQLYRVLWRQEKRSQIAAEVRRLPEDEPLCRLRISPVS